MNSRLALVLLALTVIAVSAQDDEDVDCYVFANCKDCTQYSSCAWCQKGKGTGGLTGAEVEIEDFCWYGNPFTLKDNEDDDDGKITCNEVPQWKQCKIDGVYAIVIGALVIGIIVALIIVLLCACYKKFCQ
eukprot:TRINITY_DN25261_c0_g1_i1.p1 TRINITY_DN25261_c0_g1~~TRINITY_DN25261_c0_g1_i1.p1  ORF type:complete len:131 (-),score=20.20 TRINITY_DN25261_c0_g1_i1:123-515(-)